MHARAVKAPAWQPAEVSREAWIEPLRWCAWAIFVALPVLAFLVQPLAGRVVWTIAVAGLPLIIALAGYHHWRRICPLAWFANLAAGLSHPGERRASSWLQANYYYVVFAIFFVSLWLRLVATNGNGMALGAFLLLLSLTAFVFGASIAQLSTIVSAPARTRSASTPKNATRRDARSIFRAYERGLGPKTTPPPGRSGDDM